MRTRDTLYLITIALLIESIVMALKHPVLLNQELITELIGESAFSYVEMYYHTFCIWVQTAIYVAFCIYVNVLDSKFPQSHFGSYFRIDMIVVIINALVATFNYDNIIFHYCAKLAVEVVSIVTPFLAGYAIFRFFKTDAMKSTCFSYCLMSLRHFIYAIILILELIGTQGDTQAIPSDVVLILNWALLMPLLIFSRILLLRGFKMMKTDSANQMEILPET